jgi:hypothetical protein
LRAELVSVALVAFALTSVASSPALADVPKEACIRANLAGQEQRHAGSFSAARASFAVCGDPSCPPLIQSDCSARIEELDKAQPSLVLDVKDESGHDLIDVTVTLDAKPLTSHLGGVPFPVDPGLHLLRFEAVGRIPGEQRVLIKEGERARREAMVLVPVPVVVAPAPFFTTRRKVATSMAGVGVLGLGVGTVFGILASSKWSATQSACGGTASRCAPAAVPAATQDRSTAGTDAAVSTAGFIAGGALVALGGVLFFTGATTESASASSSSWTVSPTVGVAGGSLELSGRF